jgi:hypothetical protein
MPATNEIEKNVNKKNKIKKLKIKVKDILLIKK